MRLERIFSYDAKRAENRLIEKYGDLNKQLEGDYGDGGGDDEGNSVSMCHRAVTNGEVVWSTKSVGEEFVDRHIGHGDTSGSC